MPLNLPALRSTLSSIFSNPNPLIPCYIVSTLLSFPEHGNSPQFGLHTSDRIRALILDKDNTFTPPDSVTTHEVFEAKVERLRHAYSCLIVSNTAGAVAEDRRSERLAEEIENKYGIPVLRQRSGLMKPFCGPDALQWFQERDIVKRPSEICVIGDRLATDVAMGSYIGALTCWAKFGLKIPDGKSYNGMFNNAETALYERFLSKRYERYRPALTTPDRTGTSHRSSMPISLE